MNFGAARSVRSALSTASFGAVCLNRLRKQTVVIPMRRMTAGGIDVAPVPCNAHKSLADSTGATPTAAGNCARNTRRFIVPPQLVRDPGSGVRDPGSGVRGPGSGVRRSTKLRAVPSEVQGRDLSHILQRLPPKGGSYTLVSCCFRLQLVSCSFRLQLVSCSFRLQLVSCSFRLRLASCGFRLRLASCGFRPLVVFFVASPLPGFLL